MLVRRGSFVFLGHLSLSSFVEKGVHIYSITALWDLGSSTGLFLCLWLVSLFVKLSGPCYNTCFMVLLGVRT